MERAAALAVPVEPLPVAPRNAALAMLARRGFHVTPGKLDLPFDPGSLAPGTAARIAEALRHYAFRLFLRGAIQHPGGFAPEEATGFLNTAHAHTMAETLVHLGLATAEPAGRYRLVHPPNSFGSTLEWYAAWELEHQLGFEVALGVKFHAPGVGGDLDVVAAAEGKLVLVELKSSPPKHLSPPEVAAFFDRVRALRPDISLFVVDTALRLADRVLPMLEDELRRRALASASSAAVPPPPLPPPRCVERDLWALTRHIYVVNARPDLAANLVRAVAEGLFALSPPAP